MKQIISVKLKNEFREVLEKSDTFGIQCKKTGEQKIHKLFTLRKKGKQKINLFRLLVHREK